MTDKTDNTDTSANSPESQKKPEEKKVPVEKPKTTEVTKTPTSNSKASESTDVAADKAADTSAPPVAAPKKENLESSVRERIEKEIASRKADSTTTSATVDPSKTATIEAELRAKLDKEVEQRQKEKVGKEQTEQSEKEPKKTDEKAPEAKGKKPAGEKSKKSVKGKNGAAGKKPKRKRPGSQTRPQLSENEQRILEQKALIDEKLKKRNKYIYAGITIAFLIGLFVVAQISKKSAAAPQPAAPQTKIKDFEATVVGGSSHKRQSSTFKAANKEAQAIMATKDYQGAVDFLTNHAEKFTKDKEACDKAIKMINDNFINPTALPPPDPKARWSSKEKRGARMKAARSRMAREGLLPDEIEAAIEDEFGSMEEIEIDIEIPGAAAATDTEEVMNDDPFGFDDSGLKEEPKKKEIEKDPLDDLDSLIE